jgi:hypothetical protein
MTDESFDQWAVVELLGHRRLAGRVREATIGGGAFLRIDVPGDGDEIVATQFYGHGAVYCPARAVAAHNRPEPVQPWELPPMRRPALAAGEDQAENPF